MPHISLEYTANIKSQINTSAIFSEVHQILAAREAINIENCKSHAICIENYYIGQATDSNAFAHLEISVLQGKSDEFIQSIGDNCLTFLKSYFSQTLKQYKLQLTVAINQIPRSAYFKYSGTD